MTVLYRTASAYTLDSRKRSTRLRASSLRCSLAHPARVAEKLKWSGFTPAAGISFVRISTARRVAPEPAQPEMIVLKLTTSGGQPCFRIVKRTITASSQALRRQQDRMRMLYVTRVGTSFNASIRLKSPSASSVWPALSQAFITVLKLTTSGSTPLSSSWSSISSARRQAPACEHADKTELKDTTSGGTPASRIVASTAEASSTAPILASAVIAVLYVMMSARTPSSCMFFRSSWARRPSPVFAQQWRRELYVTVVDASERSRIRASTACAASTSPCSAHACSTLLQQTESGHTPAIFTIDSKTFTACP